MLVSTRHTPFLPASWAGDTHEETNVLPIGDREERGKQLLNRRTDSLEARQVLVAKYFWQTEVFLRGEDERR